jgi:hypothetical protein
MKALLLGLILLSHASMTFAGSEGVGGGNLIVCRDPNKVITSLELLDYYEARTRRKLVIDLNNDEGTLSSTIDVALKRLSRLMPMKAQELKEKADAFNENAEFIPGVQLEKVDDSYHIFIPDGCAAEQVAVQQEPEFTADKRYIVSKDLWDQMSIKDKAGLILHEIIYNEARKNGATNSIGTRALNSLLASPKMETMSFKDFFLFLPKELKFGIEYLGAYINVGDFNDNGTPRMFTLIQDATFKIMNANVEMLITASAITYKNSISGSFFPDGTLQFIRLDDHVYQFNVAGAEVVSEKGSNIFFHENGNIKTIQRIDNQKSSLIFSTPAGKLPFSQCTFEINANEDGVYVDGCDLAQAAVLPMKNQQTIKVLPGHLSFYPTGGLKNARLENGNYASWSEDGTPY